MAMTRVFVFTNHKGGVGKSTSATNTALGIAGMLRRAGAPNARVLLIDTDSQAHATLVTTGTKDYGTDDSLYTVLMADRQNAAQTLLNCIVQSTWDADLHVLPASPMLEGAERELIKLLIGVIPANEAVSSARRDHQNPFAHDPRAGKSGVCAGRRLTGAVSVAGRCIMARSNNSGTARMDAPPTAARTALTTALSPC
jgi:cellulose biosynthesis protein BcsQ